MKKPVDSMHPGRYNRYCFQRESAIPFQGQVPERLKGTDCKSVIFGLRWFESIPAHHFFHRGIEQSVARRAHNPEVRGSSPLPATNVWSADVAQSVERILGKDKVTGSIPVISSI